MTLRWFSGVWVLLCLWGLSVARQAQAAPAPEETPVRSSASERPKKKKPTAQRRKPVKKKRRSSVRSAPAFDEPDVELPESFVLPQAQDAPPNTGQSRSEAPVPTEPTQPPPTQPPPTETVAAPPTSSPIDAPAASEPLPPNDLNGYGMSRTELSHLRSQGLLPTDALPQWTELIDLNAQLRHFYAQRGYVSLDASLIAYAYGRFQGAHLNLPEYAPRVSINELYLFQEFVPELTVLVGKKRVVWGPGMAYNPTDLLNPTKDPTDPSAQRAGAYLALVEVPLPQFAFTFFAAPAATEFANGLPYRFVTSPNDSDLHGMLGARLYALVLSTDINLMAFYSHKYNDAFERKPRFGASASRFFGDVLELHFEALFQQGSAKDVFSTACLESEASAFGCLARNEPLLQKSRLQDAGLVVHALLGARLQLADDSMISVEYLFQSDGDTPAEFQNLVSALTLARFANEQGIPVPGLNVRPTDQGGLPVRFNFQPRARHYLFAVFQKPKIFDDFTASLTVIANLQDLSALVSPTVSWSVKEWVSLTLSAFVPLSGPKGLSAVVPPGLNGVETRTSEFGLVPFDARWVFELRLFY